MNQLMQETCNARDVRPNDYIMFGNSLYRIYSVGPRDQSRPDRTTIDLISDQMSGPANKIMIFTELDSDHIVTVLRPRK